MQAKAMADVEKQVQRASKEIERCMKELMLNYD